MAALLAVALPAAAHNDARPSIVLPQRLVAGQPATLAVLDARGKLLPGAEVEFSGGVCVTTDATGRATFTVPVQPGVLFAELSDGALTVTGTVRATSVVVLASPASSPGPAVSDAPWMISLHDRFTISGSGFSGEADGNQATLGGRPALVLAASPVALALAADPRTAPGVSQLTLTVAGRVLGPLPVTVVALEMEGPPHGIRPKKKEKVMVRLRGTESPAEIIIHNLTPEIVTLPDGDTHRATTSGGAANSAVLVVKGLREGDFSLGVRLVPTVAGLPDTQAARRELRAARSAAPPNWGEVIDRLIRHLDEHPQHALDVRHELEKMLALAPPGEYGRRLEAAWRILIKL